LILSIDYENKIGNGTNGYIFEDLEKVKACNFCTHFKVYGLHGCDGHCSKLNKDISGGYIGNYYKVANECGDFEVSEELLEEKRNKKNKSYE